MTTIGKILVGVNFLFSIIMAALVIFVYVARTNWHHAFEEASKKVQTANASVQAYAGESERIQAEAKNRENELNTKLANMDKQLKAEVATRQKVESDLTAVKSQVNTGQVASASSAEEVTRRDAEVKNLQKKIDELNAEKFALVKQSNELRDKFMSADIAKNALMVRSEGLESQLQELAKQLAKAKAGGGAGALLTSNNPPPEDVEGLVKSTDSSGLITLTIGSDAGLSPGNTLEIYRLSNDPTKSKYLGRIRVMDVRPNEAVAKPVSRPLGTIQVGDRVANRIKIG